MTPREQAQELLKPAEVLALAQEMVGDECEEVYLDDRGNMYIRLEAPKLASVIRTLRDDERLSFRYLVLETATDHLDHLEAVYILRSIDHGVPVEIRAELDRENPHIPTLALLYSTACWHERETYDLMGVVYDGHPELTRILTGRKEKLYPLRKDAHPHRISRHEWRLKGLGEALRLPGARDRRERS